MKREMREWVEKTGRDTLPFWFPRGFLASDGEKDTVKCPLPFCLNPFSSDRNCFAFLVKLSHHFPSGHNPPLSLLIQSLFFLLDAQLAILFHFANAGRANLSRGGGGALRTTKSPWCHSELPDMHRVGE